MSELLTDLTKKLNKNWMVEVEPSINDNIKKTLKYEYYLGFRLCQKYVVQFTDPAYTIF